MEEAHITDVTEPLNLPKDKLTLESIGRHLTIDERLWLARMIGAHGKQSVLAMWPSYELQINFVRSL
jgi:hypothetical protein